MTMRKLAIRILVLALPLCAGAFASTISDVTLDDQADNTKVSTISPSNWSEPATTTVVEVTIPPAAPSAPADRLLSPNPLWAMPLKQFSATRERPIFLPSRRPPAPAVTVAEAPRVIVPPKPKEPEKPELSLVGTIAGDDAKFAIFVDQSTKNVIRLKLGEEFQGWKLQSVQGRETSFERNQMTAVLTLPQPSPAAQPAIAIRNEFMPVAPETRLAPENPRRRRGE
jgi:hypothetical protein